jgi:hypothetical protein
VCQSLTFLVISNVWQPSHDPLFGLWLQESGYLCPLFPKVGKAGTAIGRYMISLPLLTRAWPCCYIKILRYKKFTSYLISKALQIRPGPALFRDLPRRQLDPVSCSRAGPLRNTGRYHLLMLLLIISRDFKKKFEHILHIGRTWPQTNININRFVYVNISSYDYNWTHTP